MDISDDNGFYTKLLWRQYLLNLLLQQWDTQLLHSNDYLNQILHKLQI